MHLNREKFIVGVGGRVPSSGVVGVDVIVGMGGWCSELWQWRARDDVLGWLWGGCPGWRKDWRFKFNDDGRRLHRRLCTSPQGREQEQKQECQALCMQSHRHPQGRFDPF